MSTRRLVVCAILLGLLAAAARAGDVYFSLPVKDLQIVEGVLPVLEQGTPWTWA